MDYFAQVDGAGYVVAVHGSDSADEIPAGFEGLHKLTSWTGWPTAPNKFMRLALVDGAAVLVSGATLDEIKAAKREQINAWRIAATRNGFTFDGRFVSTDELGRSDIDGTNGIVSLTGAFPDGWAGYWKAEDNTLISIPDIATWKAFYGAMAAKGAANFATSQALKAQLAAATTVAEVEAVTWPSAS